MNPDDYITGTFDDNAPFNQKETEPHQEFDELEFTKQQLKLQTERLDYKIFQLQRLAQFEESIRTFGFLSYEEQTEKNEILKQYLK